MKKVLLIGPFRDYGGRDVEINIIAKALSNDFNVSILSTGNMTGESVAIQNLENVKWNCIPRILYDKKPILAFFSFISKFLNRSKRPSYVNLNNTFTKKFFNLDKLYLDVLKNEIQLNDLVIVSAQLTTKFIPEVVEFCNQKKISCLFRTTGTIRQIVISNFDFLKKVDLFIHHSYSNAENLNKQLELPYSIIDQCALNEDQLLSLEIKANKNLRFGYLGRLSSEKGILPIAKFFSATNYPFIIAGDGQQKKQLLEIIANKPNCEYIGLVTNDDLAKFFNNIDVLIIPSYEESGPLVGLEAMAAGKIIISTKVGAMEDRLEGLHSFWFQIENLSSLQLAITKVLNLNETDRQLISESVRQRYLCQYSFQAISEMYKELIKKN